MALTLQVNSPQVGYLNIRNSPSTSGALVTQVKHQALLSALEPEDAARQKVGQQGVWIQVQTADGNTGYCAAWYLTLAVAPPPSTPLPTPQPSAPVATSYGSLSVAGWTQAQRSAEAHGDLNLALRGYTPVEAFLGLKDIKGDTDAGAPQLAGLFSSVRAPVFKAAYRVNDWNWGGNCPGGPIESPKVTLVELAATPGESVCLPDRAGGDVGGGYKAIVLYASAQRLTAKYTREDNVSGGYAIHIENIEVDPNLLALYQKLDSAGRHELPAVRGGQVMGKAHSDRVGVALRDTGAFMDLRARKDWWHGY
jgi:hypothetical protein